MKPFVLDDDLDISRTADDTCRYVPVTRLDEYIVENCQEFSVRLHAFAVFVKGSSGTMENYETLSDFRLSKDFRDLYLVVLDWGLRHTRSEWRAKEIVDLYNVAPTMEVYNVREIRPDLMDLIRFEKRH